MNKVAYIIIGWNNQKLLAECFISIQNQTYSDKQIYYVDNNSTDNSVDWVRQNFSDVIVLAQNKNTGFARGNNIGIAEAFKDPEVGYIALINSDARLDASWTSEIVDFAKLKPSGACFQGTTLDYFNHNIIDSTHIYISRNGQGTQGSWRHFVTNELGPKKVYGVNAAACVITRQFIESQPFGSQLFDETLYMYLEDIDLAARSTILGWDNYLVPQARAFHMGSASSKAKSSTFSLYMTFRNNVSVLFNNLPISLLFKMLPKIIKGDLDTIRTLWRRNQKSAIWQVVKGRIVGFCRLPLFFMSRRKVQQNRKIDKDYLWFLMKQGY